MKTKKGIGVSPGVAIAPAVVLGAEQFDVPERHVAADKTQAELTRLRKACAVSRKEILDLRKRTARRIGKETASIFDFHLGLLNDKVLQKKFSEAITGGNVTAEYAVATVLRNYAKEFLAMPQYLAERVKDVYDIESRILRWARLRYQVLSFANTSSTSSTTALASASMLTILPFTMRGA